MKRLTHSLLFLAILLILFLPKVASSNVFFQWSFNIDNMTDNVEKFNYGTMNNYLFLGIAVTPTKQFIFGQNVVIWNRTHKIDSGETSQMSLTEMGPKCLLYFTEERTMGISFAYHPYTKGTRKVSDGESEKISGTSMLGSVVFHFRITKNFFMGASLNYHSTSIAESTVDEETETVSHTYATYYPALEFVLRW